MHDYIKSHTKIVFCKYNFQKFVKNFQIKRGPFSKASIGDGLLNAFITMHVMYFRQIF